MIETKRNAGRGFGWVLLQVINKAPLYLANDQLL